MVYKQAFEEMEGLLLALELESDLLLLLLLVYNIYVHIQYFRFNPVLNISVAAGMLV